MPILAALLLATPSPPLPPCRADRLRVSLDARDGDFNGMSHSGIELSIRNMGRDCMLVALPTVQLRDARDRIVLAVRRVSGGAPAPSNPTMLRLAAGHRAATELRWVAGPVFPRSRSVHAARISVKIGKGLLTAPLTATLYGAVGQPVLFDQTPLRAMEGMAAG